jgi:hypothetical protein
MQSPWLFGCAALAVLAASPGHAQDRINARIPAGGERMLVSMGYADPATCRAEVPAVRVVRPPAHGTIRTVVRKEPVNRVGHACHGKPVDQTVVLYKPKDGHPGVDHVVLHRAGTASSPRGYDVEVAIRVFRPAPGASVAPVSRLPSDEQVRRGEGFYEGGIPQSPRSREMLRRATGEPPAASPLRETRPNYRPPVIPGLR